MCRDKPAEAPGRGLGGRTSHVDRGHDVPFGRGGGRRGGYLTARLSVNRAATPDSSTVQPSSTSAAATGGRNFAASLPPLVIATAAPVGSHLAIEGKAG